MAGMAVAVLVLSVALSAQNVASSGSAATIVTVNREPITQADLDRARRANASTPLGRVLVDLVDDQLLAQRGKNRGYQLSDGQYQMILENIKKANNFASDEQFDAALTDTNMSRTQLRANLERTVVASRVLREEGLATVSFTDEDLQRYFDAHLDQFPVQTFESAKSDVIERLKSDTSTRNTVLAPYLQPYLLSLRRSATVVWTQPDLQRVYDEASR